MSYESFFFFVIFTFAHFPDCYSTAQCWNTGNDTQASTSKYVSKDNCGLTISGVNLDFTVSWDGCVQSDPTVQYSLRRYYDNRFDKMLCETNDTSCHVGGALLADLTQSTWDYYLLLNQTVDDKVCFIYFPQLNAVGRPDVLSNVTLSRNISLSIRGPSTPLYIEDINGNWYYRDADWPGTKRKLYMGMKEDGMSTVKCSATLDSSTGDSLEQVNSSLDKRSARWKVTFSNLIPFTNYQIRIQCKPLGGTWGDYTVFNFTTAEDVPAQGPSILKPVSVGLGCKEPDERNVTIIIEPPTESHNGKLILYDIRYCTATTCQHEQNVMIERFGSPPPPSMEIVLDKLSRWHAYEITVYANNSVGGAPSSTHQIPVLEPKEVESRPEDLTETKLEDGLWRLDWISPWEPDVGDCIIGYKLWEEKRYLGMSRNTSYVMLTNDSIAVKVTAMIYNGTTGTPIRGIPSNEITIGDPLNVRQKLSPPLIVMVVIILLVFVVSAVSCAYMCVEHGPRWTENYDFRNNTILKAALAMGELRPKAPPEKEEFNNLANLPPAQEPPEENGNSAETTMLLQNESDVSEAAAPRTPTNNQTPPRTPNNQTLPHIITNAQTPLQPLDGCFVGEDGIHLQEDSIPMASGRTSRSATEQRFDAGIGRLSGDVYIELGSGNASGSATESKESSIPMETDEHSGSATSSLEEDSRPMLTSSSSDDSRDDQGSGHIDNAQRRMSCSEDSLASSPTPPPVGFSDSGYVMTPPIPFQPPCLSGKHDGYLRNAPSKGYVLNNSLDNALDNVKHSQGYGVNQDSGYVSNTQPNQIGNSNTKLVQNAPNKTMNSGYTRLPDVKANLSKGETWLTVSYGQQSSVDSGVIGSGSLSPSDSDMGEYTKLSCPNTPVSPRNNNNVIWDNPKYNAKDRAEETLMSIHDTLGNLRESLQPGLSYVG